MTNEEKKQISAMRRDGKGYAAIASELGLTKSQVSSFCRRSGLAGSRNDMNAPRDRCVSCGREIQQLPGRKKRRFCCDECRIQWWNSHLHLVKRKAVYTVICPCCGGAFVSYGNAKRKYCSHSCYVRHRFGAANVR